MGAKDTVITFKADRDLAEAMKGIPNRSAFLRAAVLAALENLCPVCGGTGLLTPRQRGHWDHFAETHRIETCDDCREVHVVCDTAEKGETR